LRCEAKGQGEKKGKNRKRKEKWWDPRLEEEMEVLQKWRLGGELWRGMQNRGSFKGPDGVVFLHQTS
jgi:hypothetical protein